MTPAEPVFRKSRPGVPAGYFAWEAAGLAWLAAAPGGAAVVPVCRVADDHLDLARLHPTGPSPVAAEALGRALAATHTAGATAYGVGPDGWAGDGFLGPLEEPLPLTLRPVASWGAFWAEQRVLATLRLGRDRGTWDRDEAQAFEGVARRLGAGEFDDDQPPARLHGDLWSGNVLWTADGAVLIDPAAHGGHRETDLAMMALFGFPWLDRVLASYAEVHPLVGGWRDRVGLHQLHPVMVHAVLFGGGYVGESVVLARRYA